MRTVKILVVGTLPPHLGSRNFGGVAQVVWSLAQEYRNLGVSFAIGGIIKIRDMILNSRPWINGVCPYVPIYLQRDRFPRDDCEVEVEQNLPERQEFREQTIALASVSMPR